jgi:hypothetical protein
VLILITSSLEQELVVPQKVADIELKVACSRYCIGRAFTDTLTLEFSETVRRSSARTRMGNSILSMIGYNHLRTDIDYVPLELLKDEDLAHKFFKSHKDRMYAADKKDVQAFAVSIFSLADAILEHPYSLAMNVSVDGLEYFDDAHPKKSRLYLVRGGVCQDGSMFYNSADEQTYPTRERVLSNLKAA